MKDALFTLLQPLVLTAYLVWAWISTQIAEALGTPENGPLMAIWLVHIISLSVVVGYFVVWHDKEMKYRDAAKRRCARQRVW